VGASWRNGQQHRIFRRAMAQPMFLLGQRAGETPHEWARMALIQRHQRGGILHGGGPHGAGVRGRGIQRGQGHIVQHHVEHVGLTKMGIEARNAIQQQQCVSYSAPGRNGRTVTDGCAMYSFFSYVFVWAQCIAPLRVRLSSALR
jgi:hypothetical protein